MDSGPGKGQSDSHRKRKRKHDNDRSRSPARRENGLDRRRSRSPLRDSRTKTSKALKSESGHDEHQRSRQRSPPPKQSHRSRQSENHHSKKPGNTRQPSDRKHDTMDVDTFEKNVYDITEDEIAAVMHFSNFRTTKNSKVPGNDKAWGVSKNKTIQYRQYMNRTGGFNRPLSPGR